MCTVQADFDRIALLSDDGWDHNGQYHRYLLKHIPAYCEATLEVGCGTGSFARLLAGRSGRVVALDLSPRMIDVAVERSKQYPNIQFKVADAETMHDLVKAGTIPGLLAYVGDRPVGWISVGPREQFARLQHSPTIQPAHDLPVWSIVCFFTRREYRRQGITEALIQAAVQHAAARGAATVEAYPVDGWGDKTGPGDAYTGMASTFRRLDFSQVGVSGRSRGRPRLVMRYDLPKTLSR